MFYRIRLVANFNTYDPIGDIMDKVLDHWNEAKTINPGKPNAEPSILIYEQCSHDSEEPSRCIISEEHKTTD